MKRIKINTYAAFFIITMVGAGASFLIIKTANSAEAPSSYYASLEANAPK
jgi:hypothetical protein